MSSIEENVRVSLDLDVNKPDVDLSSLKGVTGYLSKIETAIGKLDKLSSKVFDFDSIHPETLQVLQVGLDEVTKSLNVAKEAGKDMGSDLGMELRMLETELKSVKTFVNEMSKSGNINISTDAPKLFDINDTKAQLATLNKSISSATTNASQSISKTALASSKVVNSALHSIGSTGEKVFSKIGAMGIATFKGIASGVMTALVHPISSIKSLESVLLKPFKSLNSLLPKVSLGIRGVTSGLLALGGVAGLIMLGKQSVQLSSNLEEMQNVSDVVFGNMSKDIDTFATHLAPAFGESELQAKKFTSTLGAMLSSMGVAKDSVLVMSKNMSALAGDMASFYNIPIEEAFNKIRSGISGETEPLKQLGINMNQASLDAYAMSQGITTSVSKLSQSEQAILRYNYLLSATANAHGDFARTQLSWANSCRQISMNVQTIFVNLGAIVKTVLSPVLNIINLVTGALAHMLSLVGAKFKGTTASATSGMNDLNSQISNASDSLDNVADSATKAGKAAEAAGKKAKLGLASFDQLNNLSSQQSSDSGSSGGSGGVGGAGAGAGVSIDPNSYIEGIEWSNDNPLQQWVDKFYDLLTSGKYAQAGDMCAKSITSGLKKVEDALDSTSLYTKINDTNMALSNFLRGLVSDQNMWTQLGNTIGSGINLIAFSINNLYANLTANKVLSSFGQGIASTINASLENTDWSGVGSAIVTGIRSGIDIAFYTIMSIDFSSLGTALKDGCSGAINRVFGDGGSAEIGGIIAGAINGAMNTVIAWLGDGTIATSLGLGIKNAINTAINNIDAESLGSSLTAILTSATNIMTELRGIDFNQLFTNIVNSINTAIENGSAGDFLTSAIGLVGDILSAIINALPQIDWGSLVTELKNAIGKTIDEHPELADVGIKIVAAIGISKALKGLDIGDAVGGLKTAFDKISPLMSKLGDTKAITLFKDKATSSFGKVSEVMGKLGDTKALAPLSNVLSSVSGSAGGLFSSLSALLGPIGLIAAAVAAFIGTFIYLWNTSETFREAIQGIIDTLVENLKPIIDGMKESLSEIGNVLLQVWDVIANVLEPVIVAIVAVLASVFEGIMKIVGGIIDVIAGIVTLNPDKIIEGLSKILDGLVTLVGSIIDGIAAFFADIWAKIGDFVTNVVTKIGEFFANLWDKLVSFIASIPEKIIGFFSDLHTKFQNGMSKIAEFVGNGIDKVVEFFKNLPSNVKDKVDGFISNVKEWFGKIPDNIKDALGDLASIGKHLVEGIWNGINDATDWIIDKIKSFGDSVMKGLKDFFGIHSPSRLMRDQIGIYLGQGIGVGIEESTKDAVASATQMGSEVMSAVSNSIDPDALKFADMKLSLADVSKTDNLGTTLQSYNSQMDSLVAKAQAFRDAMNEVSGKYSLDTLKVLLGDYRKVNSGDDTTPQRVVIAGQERVVTVSGMSEGVSANEVMNIVNDNARRF